MTASDWLKGTTNQLSDAGIESARLDAILLLCDELGVDKTAILAYPERKLQRSELQNLSTKVTQRTQHTPLAYLRGQVEFYGREFSVSHHVLVPRPESEAIIELCRQTAVHTSSATIIDIGTGSGCLAITAKLELPDTTVYATDINKDCLSVARTNAEALHATINLLTGNLLEPLRDSGYDAQGSIILANLPYVPLDYPINAAAKHEPRLALFSGRDGLDHYRTLFSQIHDFAIYPSFVIAEALESQHDTLADIAQEAGYALQETAGLAQLFSYTAVTA